MVDQDGNWWINMEVSSREELPTTCSAKSRLLFSNFEFAQIEMFFFFWKPQSQILALTGVRADECWFEFFLTLTYYVSDFLRTQLWKKRSRNSAHIDI